MRARCYIRVSTDEQAREGFSLPAQEERCRQFMQSQGWDFAGIYNDDGYSAKDLNRPAMQQIIQDVKNKAFDVLVVYRLDRLVRSVMDLHYLLDLFDKHDVKFKSVTEVFDTTSAMGRFFITLVGAMSQWERENLSERVKMGMERRFMEGKRLGHAPFGYDMVDGKNKLVVNPEEAEVVKRIFKMYKHHGMTVIAQKLNQEGIRTKTGVHWFSNQIEYILKNHMYIGQIRYNTKKDPEKLITIESDHEPIISVEEFEQTQELIAKRKVGPAKALTSDYPFSGITYCARCGSSLYGGKQAKENRKNGYYYFYRCPGRHKKGICDQTIISEKRIAEAIFDRLNWIAQEVPTIPDDPDDTATELKRRTEHLEAEIKKIRKRRKKWQEAYAADAISLDDLIERTQEDREREEKLKKEMMSIPMEASRSASITQEEFVKAIQDIRKVWDQATRREQKELIHSLFKKIVINREVNSRECPVTIVDYELA